MSGTVEVVRNGVAIPVSYIKFCVHDHLLRKACGYRNAGDVSIASSPEFASLPSNEQAPV